METARTPYSGPLRKLVIALDIGTTFSSAAFAFLDPGKVPRIRSVARYLRNPNPVLVKVPSILYYDHGGNFCGVENGADFQDEDAFLMMKWWKLIMSPTEPPTAMKDQISTRLPKGKTIVDVFADFMRYLFDSTRAVFEVSDPSGESKWESVSNNVELVLTHPNGWGIPQQEQLRTAAVKAGVVPDTTVGRSSVHFVTEGEASFNFCATHTQAGRNLKPGEQVLIIDAGGGTIDINTYTVLSNRPLRVEELCVPMRLFQGWELVTARARAMIQEKLKGSRFNTPGDLAEICQRFDEGLRKVFSNDEVAQYVKFGSPRDNDPKCGIKAGKLMLTGAQVSGLFEPSIQSTLDAIGDHFRQHLGVNSLAFLIGSFAASPWFSSQLEKRLLDIGLKLCQPDADANNAIAVGAASYYVYHFMAGRVTKFTYGVLDNVLYDPSNPEHVRREHKSFINPMGEKHVPGHFIAMLPQGTRVLEDREIRHSFSQASEDAPPQYAFSEVVKYTGSLVAPEWQDVENDKFETLCRVKADLSAAPYTSRYTAEGKVCYKREYDVIFLVGLTELKTQASWIDTRTRTEKRNGVVVVCDDPLERTVGNSSNRMTFPG